MTPLTSLLMAEMLAECGLPEGVFQVATGRGETGAALVDEVDMVMFTGSVETGKKVMARAAETLTPVSLELGGKDPMIVLADADLERAANAAVAYGMNNSGQVCISVERIYVEEPVHDEFVERVTREGRGAAPGPARARPGSVDVGAIIFPPQIELIDAHVRDAVDKGAEVVTGGKRGEGPGRFYEPTVLAGVDHSMRCMTEETFGPTLPVMRVADAEEAVRLANDGPYGLQASVWTRDTERGEALARRIEAGVCCVNDAQLNYARARAADGRLEGVRAGLAPRARRDPQVHEAPVAAWSRPATRRRASSTCFPYSAEVIDAARRGDAARSRPASSSTTRSGARCSPSATRSSRRSPRPRARTAPATPPGSGRAPRRTSASPRRSRSRSSSRARPRSRSRGCAALLDSLADERHGAPRRRRRQREALVHAFADSGPEALAGITRAARPRRCRSSTRCPTSAPGATRTGTRSATRARSALPPDEPKPLAVRRPEPRART